MLRSKARPNLAYYVFDIVHLGPYSLMNVSLQERKNILRQLLASQPPATVLRYSEHVKGAGARVWSNACKLGLEGVISKRIDSAYSQTRSMSWVKTKCIRNQEFVIAGYTDPSGSRKAFGALLLGYYEGDALHYAGRVGTGFTEASLQSLFKLLRRHEQKSPAYSNPPISREARGVHWLKPVLVCEVEFTEWTSDGQLRHPSFKGIREDKAPRKITRETPKALKEANADSGKPHAGEKPRAKQTDATAASIGGIAISNPKKMLYPEGIAKLEVAEYYDRIADCILPHIQDRPLTLVRCPNGYAQKCFYQKHMAENMPAHVHGIAIREKSATDEYLYIQDKSGLLELVNLGVLEFHVWGCRIDAIERPDIMVFDLDPDEGLPRNALVAAVRDLRDRLENIGLQSFLKTSGGKGFHIAVPLQRKHDWDGIKAFSKAIAAAMAREKPALYTATMSKIKRRGKVYIDYLRNSRGATFIAPFSTRARRNAPISLPLAWDELSEKTDPAGWTITAEVSAFKRGERAWKDFYQVRQSITAAMVRKLAV
jgi:bifunctional non-homologous end joining protein LigD